MDAVWCAIWCTGEVLDVWFGLIILLWVLLEVVEVEDADDKLDDWFDKLLDEKCCL